ncbi:hypothetical protein B5K08_02125 [Rhizobium leguminosarum bv. trifolii]|uniref:AB hydrolase-1 domain-containing protein n=1 Tax=Rhizobium leguminosarum bv. trifolii TaxID=386 RepID=A0A3E1BZG4_RHILT|nr:alpha/beta hydrolase [Rhizobium leguminosarum]RFC00681.1 hypothetical protein B5K08_02125 [Rhizobium leguminosarum bv. trifolii]RFC01138.1 hypothetical protein B5K10_02125 [Rhizobium leguminosarum bv. trifolii]
MIKRLILSTMLLSATVIGSVASARPVLASDYTTTENKYVEVGGTRYAYRTIGNRGVKPPLVLFQHFTGTMDDWDRRTVEGLAKGRELIIFDNAGVGASEGQSPDSVAGMAEIAVQLIEALKLQKIDALGFSLGGSIVQQLLIEKPSLDQKGSPGRFGTTRFSRLQAASNGDCNGNQNKRGDRTSATCPSVLHRH